MAKTYKSIVKSKLLKEIFYQIEFFGKKLWMKAKKPFVLAAGTSAGKTLTSLIQLEIFYSIPENVKKITLIISSSKTVLRENFAIALEQFNPSFSYYVVTNKKELQEAIKDGYQVIVVLPQTLNNNYKLLPKVTNFILDEAHQWYFKTTIQKIIKHCKPTRQLLLTGTPSCFNAKSDDFEFYYVPVMDLYENDLVSNIKIEVVSSSYDFKQTDYLSHYGNLKADKTNSPTKSKEAFKMVCDEMILKLRGRLGNKYLANLRGANKISALFNDLKKTIIFCHSLKQANAFYKELSSMKGLNDMVLLSHSENDRDSEYFEMFRTDSQYKVLVAVDRGKLGYNLPDLFNVVDFSMTQSLDMILQMLGRILRLSDKDNEKIYFKVATKNTAGYFVDLMTAALCLFKMEWYSKFNGKNMGGILIPKVKTIRPKPNSKSTTTNKKKQTQRIATLEELGIPLDLNLFNQSIMYSQGDKFSTVAWTTLDEVRKEFFGLQNKWNEITVREEAKKYNSKSEFIRNAYGAKDAAKRLGIYEEVCSHMDKNNLGKKTKLSDKEAMSEFKRLKQTYTTKKDVREKDQTMFNVLSRVFPIPFKKWYNSLETLKRNKPYSESEVRQLAKKYPTRKLMQLNGHQAGVKHAVKNGYADEIFQHGTNIWSKELVIKELKKYKHKQDIRENNPNLRNLARKYNLWNGIANKTDTEGFKKRRGLILQKNLDGKVIKKWSLKDACEVYGSGITNALYRNKGNLSNGFIWEYEK